VFINELLRNPYLKKIAASHEAAELARSEAVTADAERAVGALAQRLAALEGVMSSAVPHAAASARERYAGNLTAESHALWSISKDHTVPASHARLGRCVADICAALRHIEGDAMRCEALGRSLLPQPQPQLHCNALFTPTPTAL